MMGPGGHAMLADVTHDELSRESFVISLKEYVVTDVTPGNKIAFDRRVAPAYERANGEPPGDRRQVLKALLGDDYYRMSSSLKRLTQELMWDSVGESVERQAADLIDKSQKIKKKTPMGSLRLNPEIELPRYLTAVDIHCMPGNYTTDLADDDVFAGALYDRSVYLFVMGGLGAYNQDVGETLAAHLKKTYPDFKPRRILDLGCAIGHSTLPYCDAFPDAEVHAIELGAPMLRYGHARAESLGKAVHFSQQNAEHTDFPDGYFDLVISHILMHETSNKAAPQILKETHRILSKGGISLHCEGPPWNRMSPYEASVLEWDTHYNAEPYIGKFHELDPATLMSDAGFDEGNYIEEYVQSLHLTEHFSELFKEGNNGIDGNWWFFGARK
jgi:ubiquinone/menaquinone biosynthesis C-methylase UbiE